MDDSDKTIIKPRPGGNNIDADKTIITPRTKNNAFKPFSPATDDVTRIAGQAGGAAPIQAFSVYDLPGLPPLVKHASPLLSIISQLKQLDSSVNIEDLRQHISQLVTRFIHEAKRNNDTETVRKASYALCTTIDEAILNTSWGADSAWTQKPILHSLPKETYGGDGGDGGKRFYSILDREVTEDVKNYDLIELLYICLSLGFLGKMRIDKHGTIKAEKIRANTYQLLIKNRNRFKRQLSSNIKPITAEKSKLYSFLPIWLLAATLTLIGFWIYNHWLLELNKQSDQLAQELALLIPAPKTQESLPEGEIRKEIVFLRQLLQQEIELDILSVNDYHNRSSVVLHSNELFPSGSTDISTSFHPILNKIAKALESIPGRIIISGHTDNIDIRTARFPSNWHLSLARASAVGIYMSSVADLKARLLPEGRGDREPVADNNTPEGRAQNRRVVIELFYQDL